MKCMMYVVIMIGKSYMMDSFILDWVAEFSQQLV